MWLGHLKLTLESQYQHIVSYCSPYILYSTKWESFFINQGISSLVTFTLMVGVLDQVLVTIK